MSDWIPTPEQLKKITGIGNWLKPSVGYALSDPDYRAFGGCNQTFLKCMVPRPGSAVKFFDQTDKPAFRVGRYVHQAILTPDVQMPDFAAPPETYQPADGGPEKPWHAGAGVCKEWAARQAEMGREVLSHREFDEMSGCIKSLSENAIVRRMLAFGNAEVSCFAPLEINDVRFVCKTRIDWVPKFGTALINIKTTLAGGSDPHEFRKQLRYHGYGFQAAYELKIWNLCNPDDQRTEYVWPVVEKSAPFVIQIYYADEASLAPYRTEVAERLETFANCIREGVFPGDNPEMIRI